MVPTDGFYRRLSAAATNLWLSFLLGSVSLYRTGLARLVKGNILVFPSTFGPFSPFLLVSISIGSHTLHLLGDWSRDLTHAHAMVILSAPLRGTGAVGTLQVIGSLASPSPPALKGCSNFQTCLSRATRGLCQTIRSQAHPARCPVSPSLLPLDFESQVKVEASKWNFHQDHSDTVVCMALRMFGDHPCSPKPHRTDKIFKAQRWWWTCPGSPRKTCQWKTEDSILLLLRCECRGGRNDQEVKWRHLSWTHVSFPFLIIRVSVCCVSVTEEHRMSRWSMYSPSPGPNSDIKEQEIQLEFSYSERIAKCYCFCHCFGLVFVLSGCSESLCLLVII